MTPEEIKALQAERDALKAERDSLKDQVETLKSDKKTLQDKLDAKDKELVNKANEAIVDQAIAENKITAEEKSVWLKRLETGGDAVKDILNDMEAKVPHSDEQGTSQDKQTNIGDVPPEIVAAYKEADPKISDEQILKNWEEDNR